MPTLPRWLPASNPECAEGSLWDYIGFPPLAAFPTSASTTLPVDFPRRAYAFIWNEYFRDENLQEKLEFDPFDPAHLITTPLLSNWEKDRYTSALKWQQRGTSPAVPISGMSAAVWEQSSFTYGGTGMTVTGDASLNQIHVNNVGALPHF